MKSIIIIAIGTLLSISGISVTAQPLPYMVIESNNECSYDTHIYAIKTDVEIDDTSNDYTGREYYYTIDDSIPSAYGGRRVLEVFSDLLDLGLYEIPTEVHYDVPITAEDLYVISEYNFAATPDFLIVCCYSKIWHGQTFYIGVNKTNGEYYQLNGFNDGQMLIENYNRMIKNDPDLLPLSEICLAKLLVKLHVGEDQTLVFVESVDEVVIADLIFSCEICKLPGFDFYEELLYLDNISDYNDLIAGYGRCLENNNDYRETADSNKILISGEFNMEYEPKIEKTGDGTDIYLTAISINNSFFSSIVTDYLARWKVSMDKQNMLKSISIVGERLDYRLSPCGMPIPIDVVSEETR
jgi:hypothetical protein